MHLHRTVPRYVALPSSAKRMSVLPPGDVLYNSGRSGGNKLQMSPIYLF